MNRIEIFMVAGGNASHYARLAIESLFKNCKDTFSFSVLTDSAHDKLVYEQILTDLRPDRSIALKVYDQADCDLKAATFFAHVTNVQQFRAGHPCWRKITDPSLFATENSNIIVLDPDIVFPSEFKFEPTIDGQLILMRQHRHCLLPSDVVMTAFRSGIRLAHHTDIGVAQHTVLPWLWIDDVIGRLGGIKLPRIAHIESILWAAIAMQIGGGYLAADVWSCWERTILKRLIMMAGVRDYRIFRVEPIQQMKCFHGSSGAKDWLLDGEKAGLFSPGQPKLAPSRISPFIEITLPEFEKTERRKQIYHRSLTWLGLADPLKT